jgi:hypothetical protein
MASGRPETETSAKIAQPSLRTVCIMGKQRVGAVTVGQRRD